MDVPLVNTPPEDGLEVPELMLYIVYAAFFVDILSTSLATTVMPYYAQSFHVPVSWIGYTFAAWNFSSAVFAPVIGGMADKRGRKCVLVICLLGAGISNVLQGAAVICGVYGFWVFLFGRFVSGACSSVMATCNVYVTDVAGKGVRNKYLTQIGMLPMVALLTGPGIGGALAYEFGDNVPVMVGGILSLVCAVIVTLRLVETPAFLRQQMEGVSKQASVGATSAPKDVNVPFGVHIVGLSTLCTSLAFQASLAMYALFYQKYYGLSTLYLGFIFQGTAVVMLITSLLVIPQLRKRLPPLGVGFIGGLGSSFGQLGIGISSSFGSIYYPVACNYFQGMGGGVMRSQSAAIVAPFTTVSNRARVFALNQRYQSIGGVFGPMFATYMAEHGLFIFGGSYALPFYWSGVIGLIGNFVMLASARFPTCGE
eukprot:TRINITY_DN6530_c0_g1_i4.p1 TRINITY_DN6530_c0_g1~~TRINITY_DN6530_c0_g1_i4.p1  ORF type:complete len:425 (-),score=39.26 TRINITY_DN6530_c0_g1_i4:106-1380(-)